MRDELIVGRQSAWMITVNSSQSMLPSPFESKRLNACLRLSCKRIMFELTHGIELNLTQGWHTET